MWEVHFPIMPTWRQHVVIGRIVVVHEGVQRVVRRGAQRACVHVLRARVLRSVQICEQNAANSDHISVRGSASSYC